MGPPHRGFYIRSYSHTSAAMSVDIAAIRRRNSRIDGYRQLVRPIARHYAERSPEPLDDLIQVGLMGLLRAAERYDETSSTPFAAFARPHIRGAILHYLRDLAQPIRLPRRLCEQLDARRRCLAQVEGRTAGQLSDEELRRAMGLSPAQWRQLEEARQLTRLLPLDGEEDLGERLPDTRRDGNQGPIGPWDGAAGAGWSEGRALEALERLEPQLAAVVQRVVLRGWSYRRTASTLAVSPMTVQRRLHKGLALLRSEIAVTPPQPCRPHRVPSAVPGR